MKLYAIIMAGGVGSRFWPRSRKALPKQLLNIFGSETMIQGTVNRLQGIVPADNIFIITNVAQREEILIQLPQLPARNIIAEPIGKNTAPCLGLGASIIHKIEKDSVIINLAADHLISDLEKFRSDILSAAGYVEKNQKLLTFGIRPTRPETGYGYVKKTGRKLADTEIYSVEKFVEKPNLEKAKSYLESGEYFWNSGMFVWRADSILEEIKLYLPELSEQLKGVNSQPGQSEFESELQMLYEKANSISIDYGIMERSQRVCLKEADFDWSDVGSWETVFEISAKSDENNAVMGDVFVNSSSNSYIYSPDKFTAVIGVEDLIIINTKDSLLVCNRKNSQDVKKVVDYLKEKRRLELI